MEEHVEQEPPKTHPIFEKDPGEWIQHVYKEVCVTTEDGNQHTGWVYTIDPVSDAVVLVKFNDHDLGLKVVMGHSVQSIVVVGDNTELHKAELDQLFKPKQVFSISPEEVKQRQERLLSWLHKNRIPIKVTKEDPEVLNLSDALYIDPPYGAENCRSTNQIILGKIQGLIKNIPKDIEDW